MPQQSKPHTQEYIIARFEERGCKLLGKYKNKYTPVAFICKCGKKSTITYNSFRNGSYCMNCGGKKKITTKQVQKMAKSRGCELLSEYINAHSKITIKCKCGEIYETVWSNFREGRECKKCGNKKNSENKLFKISYVSEKFRQGGCKLLSKVYCGNHKPLEYICCCGNKSKICFSGFQNGQRCQKCRQLNMSGPKHPRWEKDRAFAKLKKQIRYRCHGHIKGILNKTQSKKTKKSADILGYKQKDLVNHITNHKNWNKVKDGVWHIDHIFPIKAFLENGVYDIAIINCLKNLQPLSDIDNFKKNSKYNKIKFKKWLMENFQIDIPIGIT